jgi:hypothetical protein
MVCEGPEFYKALKYFVQCLKLQRNFQNTCDIACVIKVVPCEYQRHSEVIISDAHETSASCTIYICICVYICVCVYKG